MGKDGGVFDLRSNATVILNAKNTTLLFVVTALVIFMCTAVPLDWPETEAMGFWLAIHAAQTVAFAGLISLSGYMVAPTRRCRNHHRASIAVVRRRVARRHRTCCPHGRHDAAELRPQTCHIFTRSHRPLRYQYAGIIDSEIDRINQIDLAARLNWCRSVELKLHLFAAALYVVFWVHSWLFLIGALHVPLVRRTAMHDSAARSAHSRRLGRPAHPGPCRPSTPWPLPTQPCPARVGLLWQAVIHVSKWYKGHTYTVGEACGG